ncbi:DUF3570 domain-containing protein [Nannocystaceae bacterium ST9]
MMGRSSCHPRLASFVRLALTLIVTLAALATPRTINAEDRITVRGNYYRETSTRVMQPMVHFRKELPDERFAVEAEYLLDVISSASIAAGTLILGGDKVFTEMRHETTLGINSKVQDWTASAFYRYSTETDYTAHNFGFGLSRSFLRETGTLSLSYSTNLARAYRITNNIGARSPWMSTGDTNQLQVHYLALGYSHVLTKTLLGGVSLEGTYSMGPQDNPYRRARNGAPEHHPWTRRRLAPMIWALWSIPRAKMVVEPRYRFYGDDWGVLAHAADLRLHFRPHPTVHLRLRYRYYTQTEAKFWRDDGVWADDDPYRSDDPKMDDFHSNTVGGEIVWELDGIAKFTGLRWLAGAWIQATYNHSFVRCRDLSATCNDKDYAYGTVRTTRYGDARIGDLAFSIAF